MRVCYRCRRSDQGTRVITSPKPPSGVTFEALTFAEAMHSEIGRPERRGALIVATGRCTVPISRWYCSEGYGGLEMTRTSDLFRVKEAL